MEPAMPQSQVVTPIQPPSTVQPVPIQAQTMPVAVRYAGFWSRLVAFVIDGIVLNIAYIVLGFIVGFTYGLLFETEEGAEVLGWIISILTSWLYYALMESSSAQATLGKMALGVRVTNLDGKRISFGKATVRYLGRFLSAITLGIGYLMIVFTEKKQGLHDMIAGTLVLKK